LNSLKDYNRLHTRVMKLRYLLFASTCIATCGMAQNLPKVYQDLERNYEQQNFEACIKLEPQVEALAKNQRDTLVANSFFYIGDAHHQLGDMTKAISWFEREKNMRADIGLTQTDAFSSSLYNLAYIYLKAGKYTAANLMADQLIANDQKMYGPTSVQFISTVLNVVDIFIQVDKYSEAEKLLQSSIRQQQKNSIHQGVLLNKLGDIYTITSQYTRASKALQTALIIIEKTAGRNSPEYISASINLGILYMSQGKYAEAEEAFDYALGEITQDDNAYAATLNNQALVYQNLGQLERAEKTFREIQAIDSAAVGTTHPDFAITLTNLGLVYSDEGQNAKAEATLLRALEIQKQNDESKTVSYARKLNNLARAYRMAGAPGKAIPLHEEALSIFKKTIGENTPEYATTSYNLGIAFWKNGNGVAGIKYLKSAAAIRASRLGKKHPKYAESMQKIAEYQWQQKQLKEARQTFGEVFDNYYYQINTSFPVLTEEEKAKFFYNNIRPSFEKFNSFAMELRLQDPTILGDIFNHQVNTKAAIMYATEKVKEAIQVSKDTSLIRQFDQWQSQKEQLAKLYSQNSPIGKMDSLQQAADLLEKDLTRKSSTFASQFIRKKITWQEIQKTLKQNEAAVEVIRYKVYSPDNAGSFNDDVVYAFLILTSLTKNQPDLIVLNNGAEMENKFLNFYRNNIKFTLDDPRSFKNYFGSLATYLQKNKIHKVYLSPDGVYNQININTVKNPSTQKFLLDEYDVRLITNTRELIEKKAVKSNSQSSVLIGFPKFNLQSSASTPAASSRSLTRGGNLSRGLRGGLLRYMRGEGEISPLPGTQEEIAQIAKLTPSPEIFTEDMASEGLIKQVISPMILHIATHGYFLEEEALNPVEGKSNFVPSPLLKAGIILAGAENFLKTGVPVNDDGDDGILTAYEAMNLKLEDTQLVVLSACETGLGIVKNGEGVYGLQRAFKMAGARSLIMSLWSVDDAATQELMSLFYTQKLKTDDQHEAFRQAQQKLKEKYPHPFYWGAFIMVGL
jgi:CHAT domain-containing protein/tetratricopeptide (TPR) repeat protein